LKNLGLGSVDIFEESEAPSSDEKTRLAGLISEEFSDHREVTELEGAVQQERDLRIMFSRQFEEASARAQELEHELESRSGELRRLAGTLEKALRTLEAEREEAKLRLEAAVPTGPDPTTMQEEILALRERVARLVEEQERHLEEDPEGMAVRLQGELDGKKEAVDRLEEEVLNLQGELDMRMAVHDALRQDFSSAEEVRKRCDSLKQENAEIRDQLTSTLIRLDMMEDAEGVQRILEYEGKRADQAERERDELLAELERVQTQSQETVLEVRELRREQAAGKAEEDRESQGEGRWRLAAGIFLALFLGQSLLSGRRPSPETFKGPVKAASQALRRRSLDTKAQELLETAALAALDRRMMGLPPAPPPRLALRGDLDELHSLLARVSRGEELEPTLDRWEELAASTTSKAREVLHLRARILLLLGRLSEAKRLIEVALALNPKVADAHALYGRILAEEDDLAGAEDSFRAAIRLDSKCAMAYGGLSRLLGLKGKDREARETLLRALSLQPENPDFHYDLAMMQRAAGENAEAAEHLQRFLETRSDDAYAHWFLAEALQKLGREREATEHKMRAFQLGYRED
jgi:tetratricopeptide (TPR) repeat protein